MKTIKIFVLCFFCTFVFLSCVKQEQIEELNLKIDNAVQQVDNQINTQTALFYRIIGDNIPVVVPEESQKKMDNLLKSINELSINLNDETLNESINLYLDYIKNTAPWIQEEKTEEIFFSKHSIDYYTILNNYNKSQNIVETVDSLQSFILSNNDYRDINIVIEKYNLLVDEQNTLHEQTIKKLNSSMETAFVNPDITYDELMQFVTLIEPYIEDSALEKNIQKLNTLIFESELLMEIATDLENLNQQISQAAEEKLEEHMYSIYTEELALNNYKLNKIQNLNHEKTSALLLECTEKLNKQNIEKIHEQELLQQIKESLVICNKEIENIDSNSIGSAMISILASQLATLKFNADNLTLVSNNEILSDIEKTINLLNTKEKEVSSVLMKKESEEIKKYNNYSLIIIEDVKKQFDGISFIEENKNSKKISLLLKLEEIQTSYLYLSIGTLYQQVYQEIWNSLNSENQFIVSKKAINVKKRELYE